MKRLDSVRDYSLGVGALALGALVVFLLIKSLLANPAVAGPVIAAGAALAVFAAGEYFTRLRVAQQYRWDKVSPTYAKFLQVLFDDENGTEDFDAVVTAMNEQLVLWGSPEVITAWVTVTRALKAAESVSEYEITEDAIIRMERDLMRAIRKDLGQSSRNLDDLNLLFLLEPDVVDDYEPGLVPKNDSDVAEVDIGKREKS